MIHAFIDTNVYLTFFSFTEEDLEELRKLRVAIRARALKLWTTPLVADELRRNREAKVAESLSSLQQLARSQAIPQMARNLREFQQFLEARRAFELSVATLNNQLSEQFREGELAADSVLGDLLDAAEAVEITDEIIDMARRRVELGNPPGKKGSLGDAMNWEALLHACPDGEDMHLVTADSDFVSKMAKDRVLAYLDDEWQRSKGSNIHLYRRISAFFLEKFPNIKVASELEKELRIRDLVESWSFDRTHRAIARLKNDTEFTEEQALDLFDAALTNTQISWIAGDHDVNAFFTRLGQQYADLLEEEAAEAFWELFEGEESDDE